MKWVFWEMYITQGEIKSEVKTLEKSWMSKQSMIGWIDEDLNGINMYLAWHRIGLYVWQEIIYQWMEGDHPEDRNRDWRILNFWIKQALSQFDEKKKKIIIIIIKIIIIRIIIILLLLIIIIIIINVLPKGRSFIANSGNKAGVLPKGKSPTPNSGTKVAVLLGMNRCGSFPFFPQYIYIYIYSIYKQCFVHRCGQGIKSLVLTQRPRYKPRSGHYLIIYKLTN